MFGVLIFTGSKGLISNDTKCALDIEQGNDLHHGDLLVPVPETELWVGWTVSETGWVIMLLSLICL